MNKAPPYWNKAKKNLIKKDKIMKDLIKRYSDKSLTTRKDVFFSLCKSIIGQQISIAAANSVFLKFKFACHGRINPKNVNKLKSFNLRKCGLSRQKVKGIKELAKKFLEKSFNPNLIKKMNDKIYNYRITVRILGMGSTTSEQWNVPQQCQRIRVGVTLPVGAVSLHQCHLRLNGFQKCHIQ